MTTNPDLPARPATAKRPREDGNAPPRPGEDGRNRCRRSGLAADSTAADREFYDFHRTARGYSPNTTTHRTLVSTVTFMNFYGHVDPHDRSRLIPFGKLEEFFAESLA